MSSALQETQFHFNGQTKFYRGKVRDVYTVGPYVVMLASDRISAFDFVLPKPIPYKGQVLNQIAAHFLDATKSIVPNWVLSVPHPRVTIGRYCEPFKVEMVVRGYLAGHAWREYRDGKRSISGVAMPEGMKESDRFPQPLLSPTIKAEEGHDEDISKQEIIDSGLVNRENYEMLEQYTLALYQKGTEMAKQRGLILVDTKYEFGLADDKIYLIDEVHTPDSSRYFIADGYEARQQSGERQKQLSKEFVREWLMEHNFQGLEGQQMPFMPDEFINRVSERYIELFEKITGLPFDRTEQVDENLQDIIAVELDRLTKSQS